VINTAYFPGCSASSLAREYDSSARLVCSRLGVNLQEVTDWNCCGSTAAHSIDHGLTMGLNSRNLAAVLQMGCEQVVTPCSGCFNRLKSARYELENSAALRRQVEGLLEVSFEKLPAVSHLLQFFVEKIGIDDIADKVSRPLRGLKLAAYYGCLITRPAKVAAFDDPEQPVSMDRILQSLGAETVKWAHKAECCGGPFAASEPGIVIDLGGQVLEGARQAGAEAIVVACPMCQANLDTRQRQIEVERNTTYNLPVIYFTQLIALAYGHSIRQTDMKRLLVSPIPLLKGKGLA